jgi:hypothetical protein
VCLACAGRDWLEVVQRFPEVLQMLVRDSFIIVQSDSMEMKALLRCSPDKSPDYLERNAKNAVFMKFI